MTTNRERKKWKFKWKKENLHRIKTLLLFFYFSWSENAADINGCFKKKKKGDTNGWGNRDAQSIYIINLNFRIFFLEIKLFPLTTC